MAAFTTTSPASGHVINALIVVAVIAIAGIAGSCLVPHGHATDSSVEAVSPLPTDADVTVDKTNIRPSASY